MIRALITVCFIFWDLNAYAAISLVQQATNFGGTGTNPLIVTLTSTPLSGHALIACIAVGFDTYVVTSITGGGVTWLHAVNSPSTAGNNNAGEIWYGLNASGSGTTTITITVSSATKLSANVSEWSGLGTSNIVNGANISAGTGTSQLTGTILTGLPTDLIIGCGNARASAPTGGPTNGFTAMTNYDESTSIYCREAYLVTSSTGTYSTSWPIASEYYTGRIAAFSNVSGKRGFTRLLNR